MKYDVFEIHGDMPIIQRVWRIVFLLVIIGVILMDTLVWRP